MGWCSPTSKALSFGRIVKWAGVRRVALHGLRHTHITKLLADGVNGKIESERAGNSNVAITLQLYGHVIPNMQADAAARVDAALRSTLEEQTYTKGR